ncbi:ubiquinone biosynthesis protein [Actinopolyspora biskrensis]|uniref:Ubiquinone biosynthesis protein n=1 Tax=Actinopolyspora biskrensis TaxID=1470178 RepID=A0A852Z643_9ACTN|nr:ubiquinone biosynthesis protein [Actinopolyspora biskrensis]
MALLHRLVRVLLVVVRRGAVAGCGVAVSRLLGRRPVNVRGSGSGHEWLVRTVSELGPAFVKAAQLLSSRVDLLPPHVCRALGRLHDDVVTPPITGLPGLLGSSLGEAGRALARNAVLAGSGSIACVYRSTAPDGREVAVKVRRPGVGHVLRRDLELMRTVARVLERTPMCRGVPVRGIVDQLAESAESQLDFEREAAGLEQLRTSSSPEERVHVPRAIAELSTSSVLVMDYVAGLNDRRLRRADGEECESAVLAVLRSVYRMLFVDGFVHCDLHPGNLYFRRDGSAVMVDAGFTVRLSEHARTKFTAFFYCMSLGDGPACADVVLSTAVARPGADTHGFRGELAGLVEENSGLRAADFDLVTFATRLFDLQRRYGLAADPQFVFPILSLLVLEGAVRELHPEVDFQHEAKPFLTKALMHRALAPDPV